MPNVPCGSCTECCRGPRELELREEDWGKYREYEKDGKKYLARKPNQDCVYFEGKCTIYENRPVTCRKFDCRDFINHPQTPERIKRAAMRIKDESRSR